MLTYFFYNILLLSVVAFGYTAEYANDKRVRSFSRICVFLSLFVPAAIRLEVGYDYDGYSNIYEGVDPGAIAEPGYLFIQETARFFQLDTQWIFVLSSFVMYFPICFFIGRKSYFLIVIFYTLYIYLESLSFVRQYMAVSFLICGLYYYLYSLGKKKWFYFSFASLLFHLSSALYLLTIPFRRFVVKHSFVVWGIVLISYVFIIRLSFTDFIFDLAALIMPRYAVYADSDIWNADTELGSGLGVVIRLLIPLCVLFYRKKLLFQNKKNCYLVSLSLLYIFVNFLTLKIQIFGRLNDLFSFVILFGVSELLQMSSINRKVIVTLLLFFSLLLFEKTIMHVYPYQSIFSKDLL